MVLVNHEEERAPLFLSVLIKPDTHCGVDALLLACPTVRFV